MKLAAVQIETELGNVESNLAHSLERIKEAAAHGADLACFPESVLDGYPCMNTELIDWSRAADACEIRQITAAARRFGIWVMWSFAEKVGSRAANTAILVNRAGEIVMTYRKTHLCAEGNEKVASVPGQSLDVVPVEGLNVGAMICFDTFFPEGARTMRLKGANLILHPTASARFSPDSPHNSINVAIMRTRAYENQCFIVTVNRASDGGDSALFAPTGEVIAVGRQRRPAVYDLSDGGDVAPSA